MDDQIMSSNLSSLPTMSERRVTATERHSRIYSTIRERISLLEYPPSTVIGENELAKEFGVSRTPIRSVLQRLNFEGLVDIRNGVGTVVTDIDLKTMKEVYDLRMYLTELVSELSPLEISDQHILGMEKLVSKAKAMHAKRDLQGYGRLCNELHEILISLIGSAPLKEITDNLYYRSARIWITFLPNLDWNQVISDLDLEISEMLAALKRDDLRGAVQVRRFYLHSLLTRISDYLKGSSTNPLGSIDVNRIVSTR